MSPRKPNKWTADKIAEVEQLRAQGKNWRDISKHFGMSSSGAVYNVYQKYRPGGVWRPTAPWQPENTAPNDQYVLITNVKEICIGRLVNKMWVSLGLPFAEDITHWMHLPYLPTGEAYE
jgi:hypothetical protein